MFSRLANPSTTMQVLADAGLNPKYSYGQNFLVNDAIIGKILNLSGISAGDKVIEVGPGLGTLTLALLNVGAEVFALELDSDMFNIAQNNVAKFTNNKAGNFYVRNVDALKAPFDEIESWADGNYVYLVSNLPYAVAATIVLDYFQKIQRLKTATIMVQREVANRMMATPNTKNYGAYTVKLAMQAKHTGHFKVSCNNFIPAPRVESTVIRLVRNLSYPQDLLDLASEIANAAFAHRRKTIANSIKQYCSTNQNTALSADAVLSAFQDSGISNSSRAEALPSQSFIDVASRL